ncbi:MAG: Rne/Rng family ribonuclease [Polyangiaceae bacterium]|nr:Rne/Rng family ribonuclease [Polyangiaceae bacterium]
MAKNILVINVDICETRVALIENGIIAELHLERHGQRGTLGNVYVGKVSRVLPGMQAAFIDIGQERAAFLHVEDLIRPDDLDAYLAGKRQGTTRSADADDDDDGADDEIEVEAADAASTDGPSPAAASDADEEEEAEAEADADAELDADEPIVDESRGSESGEEEGALSADFDDEDDGEGEEAAPAADGSEPDVPDADFTDEAEEAEEAGGADDEPAESPEDEPDALAAETLEAEPGEPHDADDGDEGSAELPAEAAEGGDPSVEDPSLTAPRARTRRGGRGRRRRGRTKPEGAEAPAVVQAEPAPRPAPAPPPKAQGRGRGGEGGRGGESRGGEGGRGDRRGRSKDRGRDGRDGRSNRDSRGGGRAGKDPLRVSKSTPIRDVVREGQEVVVQVSKEPIGTKGARVTSHISLPGRYVVYLPTVEHIGISKRIGSDKERARLREAIEAMKPPQGGLIVRTLAEGLTKKSLKADVGYLVRLWGEIVKKREMGERAPAVLYSELDLVLKTARDLFTDDIEKIVIDSREEYQRLRRFVEVFMPDRVSAIELYEGEEPLFDAYGIEDEIGRALSRKVPLSSGGHLIIDQAEALTAIDVNTGRFVGRGSRDLEETILQTNLEAVEEIAYQLRFRNIGGLIILDLIDMERASNREKVRRKLETLLAKDKAKTTLNRISDLGLIEMTRKRTRESLGRIMNEPCFYCDGTGNLQSRQTVAYEILRQIKRERLSLRGYSVVINAHPAVVDLLRNEERAAVTEAEKRYLRRIELVPKKEYHLEQFDLIGK